MIHPVANLQIVYPPTPAGFQWYRGDGYRVETNPTRIRWEESLDHVAVAAYYVDIVRASDDQVVQTLDLGQGETYAGVDRDVTIDVSDLPEGDYYSVMRAVSGDDESVSGRSDIWRVRRS